MALNRKTLIKFATLRNKSGLASNLQFDADAEDAGFNVRELGDAVPIEGGYRWRTPIGNLIEQFGHTRFEGYPVFKPTAAEIAIIKRAASIESVPNVAVRAVILEPGIRRNVEGKFVGDTAMNIAFVTEQPNDGWNDTDLDDYGRWQDFRKGVPLTGEGRGIFDFYIRKRGDIDCELCGNVEVHIVDGEMAYIKTAGRDAPLWCKDGGFER